MELNNISTIVQSLRTAAYKADKSGVTRWSEWLGQSASVSWYGYHVFQASEFPANLWLTSPSSDLIISYRQQEQAIH